MHLSESEYLTLLTMTGQALPPDVHEARFQAAVVRLARELGMICYHTHDSRHSAAGFPDLCLVDPRPAGYQGPGGQEQGMPYVYLVELKSARGKVSREQELWLKALHGKRVVAEVWRPGGMGEVVQKLRGKD